MKQIFRRQQTATQRQGSMLVETAVGVGISIVVMIAIAQLVAVLASQRAETAQIRLATQEAANIMERVMVLAWDELTEESVAAIELSPMALQGLDEPQLAIAVETRDDNLPAKQIEVRLDWRDRSGSRIQPVPLVAWKHHAPPAE